jgi:hypothetical protein
LLSFFMINKGFFSKKIIPAAQEISIHQKIRSDHQEDLITLKNFKFF